MGFPRRLFLPYSFDFPSPAGGDGVGVVTPVPPGGSGGREVCVPEDTGETPLLTGLTPYSGDTPSIRYGLFPIVFYLHEFNEFAIRTVYQSPF